MKRQKILIVATTLILIGAIFTGVVTAGSMNKPASKPALQNVRDYAAASVADGINYAIDGGQLFAGSPNSWVQVDTPSGVIVNAVAFDHLYPDTVYIGAANELSIYRSIDAGTNWTRVMLSDQYIGGVTDIAVDSVQRLVYVGTDTAGLFRLRDVGSSMNVSAHLYVDEPIIEVATDNTGLGLAFARTEWTLFRAEDYGLRWAEVNNLLSTPTAIAIVDADPVVVYVGTMDRGVVKSNDGLTWETANEGLGLVPGSRLQVDALTVDPAQDSVLYVATSYLYGTSEVHSVSNGVSMSTDNAVAWAPIETADAPLAVAELLPVSDVTGAVYALTTESRAPYPLGDAPVVIDDVQALTQITEPTESTSWAGSLAWLVAGLAALALGFAIVSDLRGRKLVPETGKAYPVSATSR